jgi:hypothetical protein
MLAPAAAMRQDFLISAAGVFQGVGQDRQAVEGAVVVDRSSEVGYGGGERGVIERDSAEWKYSEDIAQ